MMQASAAANHRILSRGGKPNGLLLHLDTDIINQGHPFAATSDNNNSTSATNLSFLLNESAFRQEGVSIGRDYLRMEGVTVTRGELLPACLDVQEVIGRGAFSTVRRARWRRRQRRNDSTRSFLLDEDVDGNQQHNNVCNDADDGVVDESACIDVAVKDWSLTDSSHQRRQMLLQELRTLCGITSPALVQLHGAFLHPRTDTVTVVLEYMDRGSLEDFLRKQESSSGGLPEDVTAAIVYQILSGLADLHAPERRMLHRDLKPANVLLDHHGNVKLCDFGMATLLGDESLNRTVLGTTKFMAPERLRAKPYGRPSDIWSLGLIVWQCVTGASPWKDVHSMVELLVTIEETTASDLIRSCRRDDDDDNNCNNLSAGLQEILVGCLQVEPGKLL